MRDDVEARALTARPEALELGWIARARVAAGAHPGGALVAVLALAVVALALDSGLHDVAQRSLNGLVSGTYFALGAVGLTLAYAILKLVNFAHADLLTLGAYVAYLFNVTFGVPLVLAAVVAMVASAAVALAAEAVMWRPMREQHAGMVQLLVMAIGFAFVIRYGLQLVAGARLRTLEVASVNSIELLGLRIGATQLVVLVVGLAIIVAIAGVLRYTSLGKQMRALADDYDLAATTGIDPDRVVKITWIFSAGLAGLAGVLLVAATGTLTPTTGFLLSLPIFAATILGGIGNAYGALVGGLVIGLSQEWSTLLIDSRWKVSVSFGVLILVLIVRPQGILGRRGRVS